MQKAVLYLVGVVFLLVAAAHVVRLLLAVEIVIQGWILPLWVSAIGVAVPLVLAWLCLRTARR
ncbi:MAG: hypothetical protein Q9M25_00200 [Mariprofundaceae bacterium]|nr:hypothetical protein [Mariprofundaceae bacterium]